MVVNDDGLFTDLVLSSKTKSKKKKTIRSFKKHFPVVQPAPITGSKSQAQILKEQHGEPNLSKQSTQATEAQMKHDVTMAEIKGVDDSGMHLSSTP